MSRSLDQFALACVILLPLIWAALLVKAVFYKPLWPVKFAAKLGPPGAPINLGVDRDGDAVLAERVSSHWAASSGWAFGATLLQALVCILMLSALAADAWSVDHDQDVTYGAIKMHTSSSMGDSLAYSDICPIYNASTCGALRAGGAFTLAWGLIALLTSLVLMVKGFAIQCCAASQSTTAGYWTEWQPLAARLLSIQLGCTVVMWAVTPFSVIRRNGDVGLGASWGLTLACFIISLWLVLFNKLAVQYRRDGEPPVLVATPANHVVIVQPGMAGQVFVMGQQAGPPRQQAFAQPQPAYGQPVGHYPQQPNAPYAQPVYGQQAVVGQYPQQPQYGQPYPQQAFVHQQPQYGQPQGGFMQQQPVQYPAQYPPQYPPYAAQPPYIPQSAPPAYTPSTPPPPPSNTSSVAPAPASAASSSSSSTASFPEVIKPPRPSS